jgi:hypothetical protein
MQHSQYSFCVNLFNSLHSNNIIGGITYYAMTLRKLEGDRW